MKPAPTKDVCLHMAELFSIHGKHFGPSAWYYLFMWANHRHFAKHEWPHIKGMLKNDDLSDGNKNP